AERSATSSSTSARCGSPHGNVAASPSTTSKCTSEACATSAQHARDDPEAQRHERQGTLMPDLKGSTTHDNLKAAFAGESQANRRYLYFAQKADVEGHPDIAALFRSVA